MKRVFLMRHGKQDKIGEGDGTIWRKDDPLSETGGETVKGSARKHLNRFPITAVFTSPLRRAKETGLKAQEAMPEAHQFNMVFVPELGPHDEERWEETYAGAIKANMADTVADLYEFAPGLLMSHGKRAWDFIQDEAARLIDEESLLLVSHNPICEMAAAIAAHEEIPQLNLKNADIVMFKFEGNKFLGYELLPAPQ